MLQYLRHTRSCACSALGGRGGRTRITCASVFGAGWHGAEQRGIAPLLQLLEFCAALLTLFVVSACCYGLIKAQMGQYSISASCAAVHAGLGLVTGRLFGKRAVLLFLLLSLLSRGQLTSATEGFATPVKTGATSASSAAAFAAGSMCGMPLSASPYRADPRPPTCASVGRDLARILHELSQGAADVSRGIITEVKNCVVRDSGAEHWPTDEPDKAQTCAALMLCSLKSYVCTALACPSGGTRHTECQASLDTIAAAVHSDDLSANNMMSEARRQSGLTKGMQQKGKLLREKNDAATAASVAASVPRAVRSDKVDLEFVYDWFHNESPDVEPDKTTKFCYKRKRCFCAGKQRDLKCTRKVLTCSVGEAVQHFMEGDVYRNRGVSIHPKNIAACICPCIKPAKRHEVRWRLARTTEPAYRAPLREGRSVLCNPFFRARVCLFNLQRVHRGPHGVPQGEGALAHRGRPQVQR